MKRLFWGFAFIICHLSAVLAQTATSTYLPGITPEGAIYLLPKTGIKITVLVEKTTYTPGELCKYAERYLRIKDASPTPSVSYRIINIHQDAFAVADTSKLSDFPMMAFCLPSTRNLTNCLIRNLS